MSLALAFCVGIAALAVGGAASRRNKQAPTSGIVVGDENHLRVTDYDFNDAGSGYRDIWSASKIESFLKNNSPVYASSEAVPGHVVFFGQGSELVDNGIVIDDSKPPAGNVVWTSAKLIASLDKTAANFMNKVPTAAQGNVGVFDAFGQVTDSGTKVNDRGSSSADLWSAEKILSVVNPKTQMKLVPSAPVKTIAIFDNAGQVESSKVVIDDAAVSSPNVIWTSEKSQKTFSDASAKKMNLVPSAKANNLAMFDGSGGVMDSGTTLNDAGRTSSDIWSAAKIQSVVTAATVSASNAVSTAVAAQTAACQASVDAAKVVNDANKTLLATLSNDLKTKMNLVPTAVPNDIAVFGEAGQVVDSKLVFNDGGASASDIWSAAKISSSLAAVSAGIDKKLAAIDSSQTATNTQIKTQIDSLKQQEVDLAGLLNRKMDLVPSAVAGRVAVFNGAGQAVDGGFALDDTAAASAKVIWSSAKTKSAIDSSSASQTAAVNSLAASVGNVTSSASSKMLLQPSAPVNAIAVFNGSGQAVASSFFVNDAGTQATDLWSAQKIQSTINTRVAVDGTPSAKALAVWTGSNSVGDSKVSIDDSVATKSNLWTAAQTRAFWASQLENSYTNKCWAKCFLNGFQTVTSAKKDLVFNITEAGSSIVPGQAVSLVVDKTGLYQLNLSIQFLNAGTAKGKYLLFAPTPTVSHRMPIYTVDGMADIYQGPVKNGVATVYFNFVSKFVAGTEIRLSTQLINGDSTPAVGASADTVDGENVGNMFTLQQL